MARTLVGMRLRGICAALAVAIAGCGSSQTQSSAAESTQTRARPPAADPCGSPSARTLAADAVARVYAEGETVYGCAHGGRAYRLGASSRSIREGRVGPVALAGVVAAYGLSRYGVDTVAAAVVVRRLSDGKQLRTASATSRAVGPESSEAVTSVVVKRNGSVAWIGAAGSIIAHRSTETEVNAADRRGERLLDSGAGINARSLRLRGSTLTWVDGGRTRSATLG